LGINGGGENVGEPTLIGKKLRAIFEEGLFSLYFKMRALSHVIEYVQKLCSLFRSWRSALQHFSMK
jgi:hypothetical protein